MNPKIKLKGSIWLDMVVELIRRLNCTVYNNSKKMKIQS